MKKTKLLIPALSIASVGAVVAPMVTSCSKTLLTVTATDYVGTVHDPVTDGWSNAKATEEYFKDAKNLAEDFATDQIQNCFKSVVEFENTKINSVNIKINDLTIGQWASKGYLVSGSIDLSVDASYDIKLSTNDVTLQKNHIDTVFSMSKSFKNCYAYVEWLKQEKTEDVPAYEGWVIYIKGSTDISSEWSKYETTTTQVKNTLTYTDGTTKIQNANNTTSSNESGKTTESTINIVESNFGSYLPSNYLSKIVHKA